MRPVVIVAAVNGGYQVSNDVARVPLSPREVADEALRVREAGAGIVHFHGRDPDGTASADIEYYREAISLIRERSDILIQTTNGIGARRDKATGQLVRPTEEERLALLKVEPQPDLFGAAAGSTDFTHPHAGCKVERVFSNTRSWLISSIKHAYDSGTTIEYEVVHLPALYRLRSIAEEGVFDPNAANIWLTHGGGLCNVPGDPRLLVSAIDEGRRVFPNAKIGVIGAGPDQFRLAATGLAMECDAIRVGLEDTLFRADGSRARSNADLVNDAVALARLFGRRPATPEETREIFQIKPRGQNQPLESMRA